MRMAEQLAGGASPMPYVKAAMELPGFGFGSSCSCSPSRDSQQDNEHQVCQVRPNTDSTTALRPHDPYVTHGNHPKCGLFEHTKVKVTRSCPACTRRDMSRVAYGKVQNLKHELKRATELGGVVVVLTTSARSWPRLKILATLRFASRRSASHSSSQKTTTKWTTRWRSRH